MKKAENALEMPVFSQRVELVEESRSLDSDKPGMVKYVFGKVDCRQVLKPKTTLCAQLPSLQRKRVVQFYILNNNLKFLMSVKHIQEL